MTDTGEGKTMPEQEQQDDAQSTAPAEESVQKEEAVDKAENSDENDGKRWYVVQAFSGHENHVIKLLEDRVKLAKLEHCFAEIVVPTEEVIEMRGGQKRKSERKFFPGYVLVRMEMNDNTWHLVKDTPYIMGFVGGTTERPAPITDREANEILRRVKEGEEKPKPKILFEPGEVVRVTDGPFADFDGVVEDVNYEKNRLRVSVSIFGRSTPVELEFGQVEKS